MRKEALEKRSGRNGRLNSVVSKSAMDEDRRRKRLYEGCLFVCCPRPNTLALPDLTRENAERTLPVELIERYRRRPVAARLHGVARHHARPGMSPSRRKGETLP